MAVCSRVADYEALTTKLHLQGALIIQPLTHEQAIHYLAQAGAPLAGVRASLQDDETLWELLDTPLMLSIATSVYQGRSAADVTITGNLEERKTRLFAAYTDAMFKRRGKALLYSRQQTIQWLAWLASAMARHNQTVFYLEWMQPNWLSSKWQGMIIMNIGMVVLYGMVFGLFFGLSIWLVGDLGAGLVSGLFFGLGISLFFGLGAGLIDILASSVLVGLAFGLVGWTFGGPVSGVVVGLVVVLFGLSNLQWEKYLNIQPVEAVRWKGLKIHVGWVPPFVALGWINGELVDWLGAGLCVVLIGALRDGLAPSDITTRVRPNEGIRRSWRNTFLFGLVFGLVGGLAVGLGAGLRNGGIACFQHFTLRFLLCCNGFTPWRYVHFLEYAAERVFLRKVGGGYIFIHRMLLEYFAALHSSYKKD